MELPSSQQLSQLLVRPAFLLKESDQQLLMRVCQEPIIDQAYKLTKEFTNMVRGPQVEELDDWLFRCQRSSAGLLQ